MQSQLADRDPCRYLLTGAAWQGPAFSRPFVASLCPSLQTPCSPSRSLLTVPPLEMEPYEALWSLMEPYEASCPSRSLLMEPYEALWSLMEPYGTLWSLMEPYGAFC